MQSAQQPLPTEEKKAPDVVSSDYSKDQFSKTIKVSAVKIPVPRISSMLKDMRAYTLNIEKYPNVSKETYQDKDHKLLYLNANYQKDNPEFWPEELTNRIKEGNYEVIEQTLILGFDHFSAQEVLSELIADKSVVIPSGYEQVGSIAHFNLRGSQLPYKKLIGQVTLDKNPRLKTVVNKTDAISNVYRVAELEVIAGEDNYETQLKEGACQFKLSFDKVYWNSRLQYERDRILDDLKENETLCDMFCGIGPLSVRAAKKGLHVVANDLNPYCYEYLVKNKALNKVESKVLTYNMDARAFMKKLLEDEFQNDANIPQKFKYFEHIYMNLPADALEFLDVFKGIMVGKQLETWKGKQLPFVRVYAFDSGEDDAAVKKNLAERMEKALGEFEPSEIKELHKIKDVSALKSMYCVGFRLTDAIIFNNSTKQQDGIGSEDSGKKVKK